MELGPRDDDRRTAALSAGGASEMTVRLIEPPLRAPTTRIENLVVSLLKREHEMPLERLVHCVADGLYRGEISSGAWVVDIGLFGSSLFVADALRELQACRGWLWEVVRP